MLKPRQDLTPNTAAYETQALVKPTGFREYDARWILEKEINLLGIQALGLGLIGFAVGKVAATLWAPAFPKFVLLLPGDAATGLVVTLVICALASTLAIRVALKVDPGAAIG